ncbi:hypothetical protein ILUMI_18680, partial [Ignelater luminosus]
NSDFTEEITVAVPLLLRSTELPYLKQIKLEDIEVENSFTACSFHFPIGISERPNQFDIISRLKLMTKKSKILKAHYQISELFEAIVYFCLPQPLIAYFLKLVPYTAVLSFLPGIPQVTCFDGLVNISDFLLWTTHGLDIGSSIMIYTYDGRLHTSLSIDKALVENFGDVQEITKSIFKYLDLLEEEISTYGVM